MIVRVRICGKCQLVPARPGQWSCAACHRAWQADYRRHATQDAIHRLRSRVDPAQILTLLAAGPHSREELAIELAVPTDMVKRALSRMVRAGQLKRTGGTQDYALASYIAKEGRPAVPSRQRRAASTPRLCGTCRLKQAKHHGYCRTCARAAGLWTKSSMDLDKERVQRRAEREAVATPQQYALRPPRPAPVSIVDEGVEYQTVDYEGLLERHAKNYPIRASSLAAPFCDSPRFGWGRHDLRRGAHS